MYKTYLIAYKHQGYPYLVCDLNIFGIDKTTYDNVVNDHIIFSEILLNGLSDKPFDLEQLVILLINSAGTQAKDSNWSWHWWRFVESVILYYFKDEQQYLTYLLRSMYNTQNIDNFHNIYHDKWNKMNALNEHLKYLEFSFNCAPSLRESYESCNITYVIKGEKESNFRSAHDHNDHYKVRTIYMFRELLLQYCNMKIFKNCIELKNFKINKTYNIRINTKYDLRSIISVDMINNIAQRLQNEIFSIIRLLLEINNEDLLVEYINSCFLNMLQKYKVNIRKNTKNLDQKNMITFCQSLIDYGIIYDYKFDITEKKNESLASIIGYMTANYKHEIIGATVSINEVLDGDNILPSDEYMEVE